MLSGQCSIRVSTKVMDMLPRLITSPVLTAVRADPIRKWASRAFTPIVEANTFSGLTSAMTAGSAPEWSISAWLETM